MRKIKIEIKNRWSGKVIFEYESETNTIKETVARAIDEQANLSDANLSDADLRHANLSDADLRHANLSDADLRHADLSDANLRGANLSGANLSDADLRHADLSDANLSDADLSDANLSGANLRGANLSGANLSGANLRGANLSGANLRGANLRHADLSDADLSTIRKDFFDVLLRAIPEVPFLKKNIIEGKIDGSTYEGKCACLSGTLFNGASLHNGAGEEMIKNRILDCRDSGRPIERFFLAIKTGDTPETNQFSKIALDWVNEFESYINPQP